MHSFFIAGTSQLAPPPCSPVTLLSCSPTAASRLLFPCIFQKLHCSQQDCSPIGSPTIPLQLMALPQSCTCLWLCWSQRAFPEPRLFWSLLKPRGTWSPHRGYPMKAWLWCWGKPMFLVPIKVKQSERQFLVGYCHQGRAQIADCNTPHLPMKQDFLLILELQLEGQASGLPHI